MASNDSGSDKVDGFPREEGDMSKRPKRINSPATQEAIEPIETIEAVIIAEPIYRQFTPRPCTLCEARRPANTNASYVYCTRGKIRFCKCKECGHTWSQEWN